MILRVMGVGRPRKLADQIVVHGAEVGDGAVDVCALAVAGDGIGVLGTLPGVCVLDEAEVGQGDQEDCNEALHDSGWLSCCDGLNAADLEVVEGESRWSSVRRMK